MIHHTEFLSKQVEEHPGAAEAAFATTEAAFNLILPGSKTHQRYRDIGSVGLAIVVARDLRHKNTYNPFDPTTISRLSFLADNRADGSETWEPKADDAKMLGGELPDGIGRFHAFALAKINGLTFDSRRKSSFQEKTSDLLSQGVVGLTGGIRTSGTLQSASGFWEVHDHVADHVFNREFELNLLPDMAQRQPDDVAEDIESIIGEIRLLHSGIEAAELSRQQVGKLVRATSSIADRVLAVELA